LVQVNINEEQVDQFIALFKEALKYLIESKVVERCPVDTGFLRNSIHVEVEGDRLVIYMADYGIHIEYGTKPHIIEPKNKKALYWKGAKHPVKKVYHPGTLPNPFIRETLFKDLPVLAEQAADIAKRQVIA